MKLLILLIFCITTILISGCSLVQTNQNKIDEIQQEIPVEKDDLIIKQKTDTINTVTTSENLNNEIKEKQVEWQTINNENIGITLELPNNFIDTREASTNKFGRSYSFGWMYNDDPLEVYSVFASTKDYRAEHLEGSRIIIGGEYIDISNEEGIFKELKQRNLLVERVLYVDEINNRYANFSIFVYSNCHLIPVGTIQQKTNMGYDYLYFSAGEIYSNLCDENSMPVDSESIVEEYLASDKYAEFLKIFKSIEIKS